MQNWLLINGMYSNASARSRRDVTEASPTTLLQNVLNDMLTHILSVQENFNLKMINDFQPLTESGESFVDNVLKLLKTLPKEIDNLNEILNKHPNKVNGVLQDRITDIMLILSQWVSLLDSGVHMMEQKLIRESKLLAK